MKNNLEFPPMFRIRQHFARPRVDDVAAAVTAAMERLKLDSLPEGASVAVAVGSRGIASLKVIVEAAVRFLKRRRLSPFIVPAMGSHGGGTADGQAKVLAGYGITEQTVGCPVRSSMETVIVCQTKEGIPVHFDRLAYEADAVLVINRIKPHTRFAGPVESGLMKMLLIGLGNAAGAEVYHRAIQDFSFQQIVTSVADQLLARCAILGGIAIVENAYHEVAHLEVLRAEEIMHKEPLLLRRARELLPKLPFAEVDVLLVDEIGKEISGAGLDTNVVGRKFNDHKAMPDEWPKVRNIALRSLSPHSQGNAIGMGIAEFCHRRLIEAVDEQSTKFNAFVSGHVTAAMTPLVYPTDRQMLAAALQCIGLRPARQARVLWIRNTLKLEEVECSLPYLDQVRQRDDLEIVTEPRPWQFDEQGNLLSQNDFGFGL